jgi:hypothetical protein
MNDAQKLNESLVKCGKCNAYVKGKTCWKCGADIPKQTGKVNEMNDAQSLLHTLRLINEATGRYYVTCGHCDANFPRAACKDGIIPLHQWKREVCPGVGSKALDESRKLTEGVGLPKVINQFGSQGGNYSIRYAGHKGDIALVQVYDALKKKAMSTTRVETLYRKHETYSNESFDVLSHALRELELKGFDIFSLEHDHKHTNCATCDKLFD